MGWNPLLQSTSVAGMAADVSEADFNMDHRCLPPRSFKNQHLSSICGSRLDWESSWGNSWCPCRRFRSPAHNQGFFFFLISSIEAHQPQPKRAVQLKGSTFSVSAVVWKWHANLLPCTGAVIDLGNTKNTIGSCQRPSLWITLTVWRARSLRFCFLPVKG